MLNRKWSICAQLKITVLARLVMLMFSNTKLLFQKLLCSKVHEYGDIVGILFLGIVLRLAVSWFTSHPGDEEVWYIVGINMLAGQGSPYGTWYFSYPPVWAYIYLPFLGVSSLFSNPYIFCTRIMIGNTVVPVMSPLFNLFIKLPIIVGDVLVGLVIYELVRSFRGERIAKKAFAFWLLNPFVVFTGAFVAQFDVFPALTSLLAFVFLTKQKPFLAGVSLGTAIMTKVYPAYFLPFFVVCFLKQDSALQVNWKKGITYASIFLIGAVLVVVFFLIPVLFFDSFRYFFEGIFRRGEYIRTVGGLSPFNLILLYEHGFQWINQYGRPQIINTMLYATQLVSIAFISFHFCFRSGRMERFRSLLQGHVCILVVIYLTTLTVNPQYMIWILPFLILGYGVYGDYGKRIVILSLAASFLAYFWAYPFYPVSVYVSREMGTILNSILNISANPLGFALVFPFALIGAIAIISLPFSTLKNSNLRNRQPASTRDEKTPRGENL